jgi:Phosphorylated adapter RNA export protein, RNA-binding domain
MDILPVDKLAEVLQESNVPLLTQVLRVLGPDRTTAILMDTLQCEANGGMWTKDGTRRRTPGGVFFQRVKQQATRQERRRLFPHPAPQRHRAPAPAQAQDQPQAPTWDEVQALIITFPPGEAAVTLTLTGRPDIQAVQARPTYVAFRMQGKVPGSLPKGLPPVPGQTPITWLVVITLRQWDRVKGSLAAHADDKLIITGHPVVASDGTHVLLAQSCVSMVQQREKKQAQQPRQAETTP